MIQTELITLRLTAEWLKAASRCKHKYLDARKASFPGIWGDFGGLQTLLQGPVSEMPVYRPQCRMRGWLLVENSTVEIFGSASLGVHSAFHPGPKPLEAGAAGPVHYWLSGASALNRSTS